MILFSLSAIGFLIGAALLFDVIRMCLSFRRVRGKIAALRAVGSRLQPQSGAKDTGMSRREVYFTVYEYKTPQGDTVQAQSYSADNLIRSKVPGRELWLYIAPDDPSLAQRMSWSKILSSCFMFLVAGQILKEGLTMPFEPLSVAAPVLIAILIVLKFSTVSPEQRAAFRAGLKERRAQQVQESRLLTLSEIRALMNESDRRLAGMTLFVAITGLCMLYASYKIGTTREGLMYGAGGIAALLMALRLFQARNSRPL